MDYKKQICVKHRRLYRQISQDTVSAATDQLLKILTMVIRAQDGHADGCLNWNVYDISVNCESKMICMQKMNVIAKISCYFECSVVTLKLRKEYLNTVTNNILVLLWIKY